MRLWKYLLATVLFCPEPTASNDLTARVHELRTQLPPSHNYDASLTTLLHVSTKLKDPPDPELAAQNSRIQVEFDKWIWPDTGMFSKRRCRIQGIYNRRTILRRGECHVDVTSPEEHGCKTVWAPLCQLLPGWFQATMTTTGGGRGGGSWNLDGFFSKSFPEQEWLIEREITLMHVAARMIRCAHQAAAVVSSRELSQRKATKEGNSFESENPVPIDHCPFPEPDRRPDLVALIGIAEREMEAKGIENPIGRDPSDLGPSRKERSVNVFQLDNSLCPATRSDLCFLGRRRFENCPDPTT